MRSHLEKRYPGGRVEGDQSAGEIKAFDADGALAVHIKKSGAGQWVNVPGAHSDYSASPIGLETSGPGEHHRENGKVHSHEERRALVHQEEK